jgi:D-sedoheptulose 7-phosphate isomerase
MSFSADYKNQLLDTIQKIDSAKVDQATAWFREALQKDQHVFVCGNGGSGSTASHFVCDILKGASYQRDKRFRILSLCDSVPTLTAYSNDVSYDEAFVQQLKNYARPGDLVLAISGSGNSPNVIKAVEYANSAGCRTIVLTGRDGGKLGQVGQLNIQVPVQHMGRIEDAHMVICHMIAYDLMEKGTSNHRPSAVN